MVVFGAAVWMPVCLAVGPGISLVDVDEDDVVVMAVALVDAVFENNVEDHCGLVQDVVWLLWLM